jgi:hypothetical protein
MSINNSSTNHYADVAGEKFAALKTAYASNNLREMASFYKLGNSFDTMIDFLDTIDDSGARDVVPMVVTQLGHAVAQLGGFDGVWFDDFGWWSIAALRALQKPFFQDDADQLKQQILDQCWPRFTNNAPFVWDRRGSSGRFDAYGPAVDGGVWNAYWEGTPDNYPGPKNGDPSNGFLVGIQNTVTNALYLMAAQRSHTDADAQAAERMLHFLLTWFDDPADPLWWKIDGDTALVRERVGHFAAGRPCRNFQVDWAWTGDQGLILGGLSDAMLGPDPSLRGPLLTRAKQLLSGVRQQLVDPSGAVQSYTTTGYVPDVAYSDYETGPGVFWRNALYVWQSNSDLRSLLASPEYQAMVRASAEPAANRPTDGQSIDALTNDIAVLVAAAVMLE